MARTKGAKNKNTDTLPHYVKLPTEAKVQFLAALIVDCIQADQTQGGKLLKQVRVKDRGRPTLLT